MKLPRKILDRLKEPSTYAGFSGIALAIGLSSEEWNAVANLLAAVFGVLAVFMVEKGGGNTSSGNKK